MKRLFVIILAVSIVAVLCGCQNDPSVNETTTPIFSDVEFNTESLLPTDPVASHTEISYKAQYIRTNGGEGFTFPAVQKICSAEELQAYYTSNHQVFDLERKDQVYSDTTIGFLDACDGYDEAFFENNYLIFVLLEEGSGSVRHQVSKVEYENGAVSVFVDAIIPEAGTCDMAQWHIIVELSKAYMLQSPDEAQIFLDEVLIYDGQPIQPPTPPELQLTEPPEVVLHTPQGEVVLKRGGYSWTVQMEDGTNQTVCADQISRPMPRESMPTIFTDRADAETVYAYSEKTGNYEPTNSLGYLMKLSWPVEPETVTVACWQGTVYEDPDTTQQMVVCQGNDAFYAKPGECVYEITATWSGTYGGTALYYAYITESDDRVWIEPTPTTIPGFCGNTQTVLHTGEETYTFAGDHSVTLTAMLMSLDYNPYKICKCLPEYTIETEFGSYGVHLTEGYARCKEGQAALTQEQKQQIAQIIQWTEETGGQYITDETEYPNYPGQWMDKEKAEECEFFFSEIVINEIYADCFIARSAIPMPYEIKMNGQIAGEWCVGDQVTVTYENAYYDQENQRIEADLLTIDVSTWQPDPFVAYKPVIYLYPEEETQVAVFLEIDGGLTCTYPLYNNGWNVTAAPDGTLTDEKGQTYNYLYWEGETNAQWDMTAGFCVKGEDTAAFLEQALAQLGLTRREANEFIVFWLPLMEQNPYNIISFQDDVYTDAAKLTVSPQPDSLIRVFMAWRPADEYVEIPHQELSAPERTGFTVVEWGGTQLP